MSEDKTDKNKYSKPKLSSKDTKNKSAFYSMRSTGIGKTQKINKKESSNNLQTSNLNQKSKNKKTQNSQFFPKRPFSPERFKSNDEVFDYETQVENKVTKKTKNYNKNQQRQQFNNFNSSQDKKPKSFQSKNQSAQSFNSTNNDYMSTFIKNTKNKNAKNFSGSTNGRVKDPNTKNFSPKKSQVKNTASKKINNKKYIGEKSKLSDINASNINIFSKNHEQSHSPKQIKNTKANKKNTKYSFIDKHYKKVVVLLIFVLLIGAGYWVQKKYLSNNEKSKSKSQVITQANKKKLSKKVPNCTASDLVLNVFMSENQLQVGKGADLGVSITNTSNKTCLAQADSKKIGVRIMSGDQKIWDSVACPVKIEKKPLLLRSGQSWTGTITWDGFSRDAKCNKTSHSQAGTYKLMGIKNGDLSDKVFVFTIG